MLLGRTIRDVLTWEGILLHLRAHVAGVDGVDTQARVLGAQHRADLGESGLRAEPYPPQVSYASAAASR